MKHVHAQRQRGFTLIEMLVSLSLFTVVVTMSVGTLLILVDANGRAQSTQLVVTNLTFTLDNMTREIRTGFNWYCAKNETTSGPSIPTDDGDNSNSVKDCSADGNYLSIVESVTRLTSDVSNRRVTYWFKKDYYGPNHGAIVRKLGATGDSIWLPLTAPEIMIDEMKIVTSGNVRLINGNTEQPSATIYIKGRAGVTAASQTGASVKEFALQTTITQRLLDH